MPLSIIILAAGQGKRMHSALPKVLHPIAHKPLLAHVYAVASEFAGADIHVVYGHGGEQVPSALSELDVTWTEQAEQLGTGHAVAQALLKVPDEQTVLILYGDIPLIRFATLESLITAGESSGFGLLTAELPVPTGYGRIVRAADGEIERIVEETDASSTELALKEVNTGMMAVAAERLRDWLARIDDNNAQNEYYLTDVVELAIADGVYVRTVAPEVVQEVMGINDRVQLAALERYYQLQQATALMRAGATIVDPARIDIRGEVSVGHDVFIDVNVVLEGTVNIGEGVQIGPNNVIRNAEIGDYTTLLPNCVVDDAIIGAGGRIGPFARIRPDTRLSPGVHIGNFVEIKKSDVGTDSKVNHLAYVGDSDIGRDVNVGAGTITCNYDGAFKHRTVIGDNAFIGSDVQLVAPVTVGAGATVGAGTTIVEDAPPGKLTVGRAQQRTIDDWTRPGKTPKKNRDD